MVKCRGLQDKERAEKRRAEGAGGDVKKRKDADEKPRGFDRGLDPERILGATDSGNELTFLIKWYSPSLSPPLPLSTTRGRCRCLQEGNGRG